MTYEVELKFPLAATQPLVAQLEVLRAERGATLEQRDSYFDHPARDFGRTDEALRIRTDGSGNYVTYKGPLIDPNTKTRAEIDVRLAEGPGAAQQFAELLCALGFREFESVIKSRVPFHLDWEGHRIEIALDDVRGLGHFVEIECLTEESQFANARDAVLRLAEHLGLHDSERRSYLQLLVEENG